DYTEISAAGVTTVEQAITAANNVITGNEVIFVAGATDGYLLINANGDGSIGGTNEFAIVLQGANSTASFDPNDQTSSPYFRSGLRRLRPPPSGRPFSR